MKRSIILLLLFPVCCLQAQQKLIQINRIANNPEEVSIAINPVNPKKVVAVSNINNLYYSNNGGVSWKERTMTSKHGVWGDPVVHYDGSGKLYYAHLGRNSNKQYPLWIDHMVVQRINNSGDSILEDCSIGLNQGKIQDKEWICSDQKGNLFLSWTEFDHYHSRKPEDHSRIRFSQSIDGGANWSKPIVISDHEGDCQDGDSTMEGATSCADSKGNLYVCWSGLNQIWFDKSLDGGKSFGKDQMITKQVEGWDIPVPNIYRANGMPFMTIDPSPSKYKDRIYVNWCDTRNGDPDVFVKYSDDGGEHWSQDIRVNNDPLGNGKSQFSNNICVDSKTGDVYVIYYDNRNSQSQSFLDVYLSVSHDGGANWESYRLTSTSFPAPGKTTFFGDYIDVDALGGLVLPIFTINQKNHLSVFTTTFNPAREREYFKLNTLQANLIDDSLYIHVAMPQNTKYTLILSSGGQKRIINGISTGPELDYVTTNRGFERLNVTLKYANQKKKLLVRKSNNEEEIGD